MFEYPRISYINQTIYTIHALALNVNKIVYIKQGNKIKISLKYRGLIITSDKPNISLTMLLLINMYDVEAESRRKYV